MGVENSLLERWPGIQATGDCLGKITSLLTVDWDFLNKMKCPCVTNVLESRGSDSHILCIVTQSLKFQSRLLGIGSSNLSK
jgi:hypothetical protein